MKNSMTEKWYIERILELEKENGTLKNKLKQKEFTFSNEPHLSQGNNDFPQNKTYVEPWESMGK